MADTTLPQSSTNAQQRRESDASSQGQGRRRSSASSGGHFQALNYERRQAMGNPTTAARRESYNDQRRQSGWLGGLWNNWVRGPSQPGIDQRHQTDGNPTEGERHTPSISERLHNYPSGSKHITGTGSGAAAFFSKSPRNNSQG